MLKHRKNNKNQNKYSKIKIYIKQLYTICTFSSMPNINVHLI